MDHSARNLLSTLLRLEPRRTAQAPADARGLYGLIDHLGQFRYIGSTSSTKQSLYERIHQRHRTGSEGMSHYLSDMYNTGRMWRERNDASTVDDGKLAKRLRNAFIAEHCRAVWLVLPDDVDIPALEQEVLAIAPAEVIAWNGRAMSSYDEPVDLVDQTIASLGWGGHQIAAVERQRQRYLAVGRSVGRSATVVAATPAVAPVSNGLPHEDYRFFALDVETANRNPASICQIGIAAVRPDNSIVTWSTYVDPQADHWACSMIHGITATTVRGAPTFAQLLPVLDQMLAGKTVFQHSSFDSSAIAAACRQDDLALPAWAWQDSVRVARQAWPELKGNGGHGLASLRRHLQLSFTHHDAGEDARATAQVVLLAEKLLKADLSPALPSIASHTAQRRGAQSLRPVAECATPTVAPASPEGIVRRLGTTMITAGNLANNHIYLREFFDKFPHEVIGGSNSASAAANQIVVEWGGATPVVTDLDGQKKFFRKRGWVREFFATHDVRPGSLISVDQIGHLRYRVTLDRR